MDDGTVCGPGVIARRPGNVELRSGERCINILFLYIDCADLGVGSLVIVVSETFGR